MFAQLTTSIRCTSIIGQSLSIHYKFPRRICAGHQSQYFPANSAEMSTIRSFIWLLLSVVQLQAYKISVDIHEFTDCPGYKSMIDFSTLEFGISEEGNMVFNGNFTVLTTIDSPYPLYIHSQKLERGEWRETIGFKFVKNFCQTLNSVPEFWYPVMKHLKKQSCPIEKGVRAQFLWYDYSDWKLLLCIA